MSPEAEPANGVQNHHTRSTNMSNTGNNITNAFRLVSQCGAELNSLSNLLTEMLSAAISSDNELKCSTNGKAVSISRYDDSGWVRTDHAVNIPLRKRSARTRKDTVRYLGFQISMMNDGMALPDNDEPLLHVFLWSLPVDFNEIYMGFPLCENNSPQVIDHRLLIWPEIEGDYWEIEGKWDKREWNYSLRLAQLNTQNDLEKHCIEPVIALLKGKPVIKALPDALPALVHYPGLKLIMEIQADHGNMSEAQRPIMPE
jgi:hypothetical protein